MRQEIAKAAPAPLAHRGRSRLQGFARFLRTKPLGATGMFLLLAAALMGILAPLIAPYDPEYTYGGARQLPPGTDFLYEGKMIRFWFGTDFLGRDLLSRVIFGARVSLFVGLSTVLLGTVIGTLIAIVSAYQGGVVDLTVQRFVDALAAFPSLILALTLVSVMGRSIWAVILALSIVNIPTTTRTVRSVALSIKETQYVEAARAIGAGDGRILFRHVLPNCLAPAIIIASFTLGWAIVVEATLSFLGVGTPPNIASWGGMLGGQAQQLATVAPWLAIFPGVALSVTVFAINLLGDALRDVLDPRLRMG